MADMQKTIKELTEGFKEIIFRVQQEQRWRPSDYQHQLLEYFWDRRRKVRRDSVTRSVFTLFESENWPEHVAMERRLEMMKELNELVAREYLTSRNYDMQEVEYRPAILAVDYIAKQHPPLSAYWQSLIEKLPPVVSFSYALFTSIGTIAGILALIIEPEFATFLKNHL